MERDKLAASDLLQNVVENNKADKIKLFEINTVLHERGFGLLILIFALPLVVPLPVPPGYTTIFSIPLILFSVQMILSFDAPWLPKWVGNRSIKRKTLALMIEKTAPYLRKVEKLLRPRLSFASSNKGERIVGVFCLIFAISIAVPLPMTNFIPAIGIVVMALGLLSKDGVMVSIGIIIGLIGTTITIVILQFGLKAVLGIIPWISNFLGGA